MNSELAGLLLGSFVRWAVTALGVTGVVSASQEQQIVGGLLALGMLAWSVVEKKRRVQP